MAKKPRVAREPQCADAWRLFCLKSSPTPGLAYLTDAFTLFQQSAFLSHVFCGACDFPPLLLGTTDKDNFRKSVYSKASVCIVVIG